MSRRGNCMGQAQVMVVEDDSTLRQALGDTLDVAGYETLTVSSGEEALSELHRFKPDIIVSDVHMNGMDGHDLLDNIQSKSPHIPFLLMTAFGNINDAVKAMRSGAIDYVEKPIDPEKLVALVSRYISMDFDSIHEPIAEDPRSQKLFEMATKVAQSDTTVLLTERVVRVKRLLRDISIATLRGLMVLLLPLTAPLYPIICWKRHYLVTKRVHLLVL